MKLRNYKYLIIGDKKVDLKKSLESLKIRYNIQKILTDTGRILGNILLKKGFVNEINLLIHPIIVGNNGYNIFSNTNKSVELILVRNEVLKNDYIWIIYNIK